MEIKLDKAIEWIGENWLTVIWLSFMVSYLFGFLKSLFTSDKNRDLRNELVKVKIEYAALLDTYNNLVSQINAKGGMSFLNSVPAQFNQGEIKNLIKLCHPDKHGGNSLAKEMTARLLDLR